MRDRRKTGHGMGSYGRDRFSRTLQHGASGSKYTSPTGWHRARDGHDLGGLHEV